MRNVALFLAPLALLLLLSECGAWIMQKPHNAPLPSVDGLEQLHKSDPVISPNGGGGSSTEPKDVPTPAAWLGLGATVFVAWKLRALARRRNG